jgi:hypothetical protein
LHHGYRMGKAFLMRPVVLRLVVLVRLRVLQLAGF